eukprot:GILI01028723.1.p1 GENE.GILI01028723.1~~GILI01028723.1.p1  ORF type:complete len:443 (-),score=94.06 GILI01028723.1:224-1552(-)
MFFFLQDVFLKVRAGKNIDEDVQVFRVLAALSQALFLDFANFTETDALPIVALLLSSAVLFLSLRTNSTLEPKQHPETDKTLQQTGPRRILKLHMIVAFVGCVVAAVVAQSNELGVDQRPLFVYLAHFALTVSDVLQTLSLMWAPEVCINKKILLCMCPLDLYFPIGPSLNFAPLQPIRGLAFLISLIFYHKRQSAAYPPYNGDKSTPLRIACVFYRLKPALLRFSLFLLVLCSTTFLFGALYGALLPLVYSYFPLNEAALLAANAQKAFNTSQGMSFGTLSQSVAVILQDQFLPVPSRTKEEATVLVQQLAFDYAASLGSFAPSDLLYICLYNVAVFVFTVEAYTLADIASKRYFGYILVSKKDNAPCSFARHWVRSFLSCANLLFLLDFLLYPLLGYSIVDLPLGTRVVYAKSLREYHGTPCEKEERVSLWATLNMRSRA